MLSGERIVSSIDGLEENWIITCKRMKSDPYIIPLTKSDSKCIKDLIIRPETVKLLEGNIWKKL